MQYRFFAIPAVDACEQTEELNQFLRGHRVLQVQREFVADGANSLWCLCVEYLETKGTASRQRGRRRERVDYRKVLPPDEFRTFARLRQARKEIAREDGVPVYAVFTNEQLAALARSEELNENALASVEGIGQGKVQRYGARLLEAMAAAESDDETGGQPVQPDR